MIKFKQLSVLLGLSLLLSSCAKVFYSPDARMLAKEHKLIAILPPKVTIAPNKKLDAAAIIEQQKAESVNFQNEIYSWLLKRKMQVVFMQEIQDVETTRALLSKAGYPDNAFSSKEICEILHVDGIVRSNFSMSKPMSEGAALAVALLVGVYGSTNEVHVTLEIKDCAADKLMFNYDHKYSGGLGSSPARLVDGLMRNASKKMPYMIEKQY